MWGWSRKRTWIRTKLLRAPPKGIPNQAGVNKCTHIVDRKYSTEEFGKLSAAEKQRLWQLRNMSKGTGISGGGQHSSSVSKARTKRPPELDCDYNHDDYDQNDDHNCNHNDDTLRKTLLSGSQVNFKTEK